MNQVTVILILALTSANASKFLQAPEAFQQDKISKQISEDSLTIDGGYNDGHFGAFLPSPNTEVEEIWESETDPRLFLASEFQGNTLHKPDELRLKRTDTSLSIVNALDVLRQRIMLEFARRKMNESKAQIQRNRELLIKTGKRSYKNGDEPLNYGLTEFVLRKRTENDDSRRALPVIPSKKYGTTRPSQNEFGYQIYHRKLSFKTDLGNAENFGFT